jgi:pimeloyl-[acyl-carrier protein] methyl ester esterase
VSKIIFLHGWSMNGDVFVRQKGSFDHNQVDAPDLHGTDHGQISKFLSLSGKEKLFLAGWSMGVSMILSELESIQPLVSGLIFISGTPCFPAREDFPQGMRQSIARKLYRDLKEDFHSAWRAFTGLLTHAETIDDRTLSELRGLFDRTESNIRPEQAMSDLDWLYQVDYRAKLQDIKVPLMIISGSKDRICFPEASRYMGENVPGSSLHIISGAGHMPFFTRAEAVNRLIKDFINGH